MSKARGESCCYKLIQRFRVTGLFAGQYITKLHGTITGVIYTQYCEAEHNTDVIQLILKRKVTTSLRKTKLNITLLRLKLPLNLTVFLFFKA